VNRSAKSHLDRPLVDLHGLDLDNAEAVTYVLRQSFRYDYDGPAADLRHRLVAVPRALHGSLRRRVCTVRVSTTEAVVRQRSTVTATQWSTSGSLSSRGRSSSP